MTLTQELKEFSSQMAERIPAEIRSVMMKATEQLAATGIIDRSLKVGDQAPDFILPNQNGASVSLADLRAKGPVVIVFYRGEWCPYCNLELRAYQQALESITALGGSLIAVSPEKPDHSLTAIEKNELSFDVLTDTDMAVAEGFGLAFDLAEELRPIYKNFGFDLTDRNSVGEWKLPVPGTYVIDQSGKVVYAAADVNYTTRPEPTEVLAALKDSVAAAA